MKFEKIISDMKVSYNIIVFVETRTLFVYVRKVDFITPKNELKGFLAEFKRDSKC